MSHYAFYGPNYFLPFSRIQPFAWNSPSTVEANPENLKRCIRLEDPFSFKFSERCCDPFDFAFYGSDPNGGCTLYSPIEYAIKLNDVESLRHLLSLPDRPEHFSIVDVFFYMECLDEHEPPNLEVLRMLLDPIENINVWVKDYDRHRNLLDYAVYQMGSFQRLHTDVIEELFKRGAKVSNISGSTPFELLKNIRIRDSEDPLLEVFTTSRVSIPCESSARKNPEVFLLNTETEELSEDGELSLNRLYKYLKLEKKYDPKPSSFLTLGEFQLHTSDLRSLFKCINVCSRFLDFETKPGAELDHWLFLKVHPLIKETWEEDSVIECEDTFEINFSDDEKWDLESSLPSFSSDWMLFDTENGWHEGLAISLSFFHPDKITRHYKFFNALVNKGEFKDCFKKREIEKITTTLSKIVKRFPVDMNEIYSGFGEEILSNMYAGCGKV